MNPKVIIVRNRRDRNKYTTDGIFALNSGTKSVLIKAEAEEISTAVDVAESLKRKMYPGIDISNISITSYNNHKNNRRNNNRGQNYRKKGKINNNGLVSKIEIELSLR